MIRVEETCGQKRRHEHIEHVEHSVWVTIGHEMEML